MPIFIVEASSDLARRIPESAKDWWTDMTGRNAVVEIVDFWPRGEQALREIVVEKRLRSLHENIRRRVELGRVLAQVPRNPEFGERNPNFVGRRAELAELRTLLSRHEMVGICAVNGVGGIGKSSLAREYAFCYRPEYLGAQFLVDLSTTATSFDDIRRGLVSPWPATISRRRFRISFRSGAVQPSRFKACFPSLCRQVEPPWVDSGQPQRIGGRAGRQGPSQASAERGEGALPDHDTGRAAHTRRHRRGVARRPRPRRSRSTSCSAIASTPGGPMIPPGSRPAPATIR